MPRSHTCPRCGADACHAPRRREPHYGWLVTDCPGCAAVLPVWEGGRHPVTAGWRRVRGVTAALVQMVVAAGLLTTVLLLNQDLARRSTGRLAAISADPGLVLTPADLAQWADVWRHLTDFDNGRTWVPLAGQLAFGVGLGLTIRALFPHLRVWRALLLAVGLMSALGLWVFHVKFRPDPVIPELSRHALDAALVPLIALVGAPIGYAVGAMLVRATTVHMRRRRSAARRRLRMLRP